MDNILLDQIIKLDQKLTIPIQPRIGFTLYFHEMMGSNKIFGSFGRYVTGIKLTTIAELLFQ